MRPSRRRSDERYDLARAGHELENARTNVEFLSNQRLPDVRLETSYRGNGLGGTQFLRDRRVSRRRSPARATAASATRSARSFSQRLPDLERRRHGELSARAAATKTPAWRGPRSNAGRRRSGSPACGSRRPKRSVRPARQMRSTAERVDAARAGATLAQQRLEAEQRRYEVGTVDDVPRHAGAARPAAGAGEPAADDARLRVVARQLRSGAAGAAARRRRYRRRAGIERPAAPDCGAARHLPSARRFWILRKKPMHRPVAVLGAPFQHRHPAVRRRRGAASGPGCGCAART